MGIIMLLYIHSPTFTNHAFIASQFSTISATRAPSAATTAAITSGIQLPVSSEIAPPIARRPVVIAAKTGKVISPVVIKLYNPTTSRSTPLINNPTAPPTLPNAIAKPPARSETPSSISVKLPQFKPSVIALIAPFTSKKAPNIAITIPRIIFVVLESFDTPFIRLLEILQLANPIAIAATVFVTSESHEGISTSSNIINGVGEIVPPPVCVGACNAFISSTPRRDFLSLSFASVVSSIASAYSV